MTGLAVDGEGNITALVKESWQDRRTRLNELGGAPRTESRYLFDPILNGPDPTAQFRAWVSRKRWFEAEAALAELIRFNRLSAESTIELIEMLAHHDQSPMPFSDSISVSALLDRILRQVPDHSTEFIAQLRSTEAELLAKSGHWARAAAAFEEAGRILTDAWITHRRFLTLLSAGDRVSLRREAWHLLDRYSDTTDPSVASDVVCSVVLVPGVSLRPEPLVSLTEIAVRNVDSPSGTDLIRRRFNGLNTDSNTRKVLEQLEEPIAFSFPDATPLEDVLKYVKLATKGPNFNGISIYIDPIGLVESEKTMSSPVKINLEGVPLKTTLRLVLKQLGLTYIVKDGFLLICFDKPGHPSTEIAENPVSNRLALPLSPRDVADRTGDGKIPVGGRKVGKRPISAHGAALYRTGRFEDAARWLKEEHPDVEEDPASWPFLAMAHHHLGHSDEARHWLEKLRGRQPSADPDQFWEELEFRLLRSEAEAVIFYDPVFPTNPFAR
jgi:hypothetical protein